MTEKVLGYVLLAVGLLVIAFVGVNTIRVFTNQTKPVEVFSFPDVTIDTLDLLGGDMTPQERKALQSSGANTKITLFSGEMLARTTNVFAHLFLMGFIASLGAKVAGLGVQLVRPIKVHLKEKNGTTS